MFFYNLLKYLYFIILCCQFNLMRLVVVICCCCLSVGYNQAPIEGSEEESKKQAAAQKRIQRQPCSCPNCVMDTNR